MMLTAKVFALQKLPHFQDLGLRELTHLARLMSEHTYPAGQVIHRESAPIKRLIVVLEGHFVDPDGLPLPELIGVRSLLFEEDLPAPITAGPGGALCLHLRRTHFYTFVFDCPVFLERLLLPTTPLPQ